MTCLHVNQKAHMACNFECLIKTEGLVKFTGSHVHCARGQFQKRRKAAMLILQTMQRKWPTWSITSTISDDLE